MVNMKLTSGNKPKEGSAGPDRRRMIRHLSAAGVMVAGIAAGCAGSAAPQRVEGPVSEAPAAQAEAAGEQERAEGACRPSDIRALCTERNERCMDSDDRLSCMLRMVNDACPGGIETKGAVGLFQGPLSEGVVIYQSSIGEFLIVDRVEIRVGGMDSQGVDFIWGIRHNDEQTARTLADFLCIPYDEALGRVRGMNRGGEREGSFRADFSGNIRGNTGILSDIGLDNFRVSRDEHGNVRWSSDNR